MTAGDGVVPLTPEVITAALEQAVTVVHPGDTLAVSVPVDMDAATLEDLNERVARQLDGTGIRVLFVAAGEFAVIRGGG